MEERLEALAEAWTSFIVEFPDYPKTTIGGREENQQVLFLCSVREENPSELLLALFDTRIMIHRLQLGEAPVALPKARMIFFYAEETPPALGSVLAHFQGAADVPVLVARKSNVSVAARQVARLLAQSGAVVEERASQVWGDAPLREHSGLGRGGPVQETLPDEASLWQGAMPEIALVDNNGVTVKAAIDLQDYRAEYACRYVLAHFQENINRDKMAEMVNLSPGYFSNLFRAEAGMSFSDYLIQVRIENAKRLLRRFDLSVEAISKQCGFNSLAHFSRTFKDRCGLSPLKFRKNPNSLA